MQGERCAGRSPDRGTWGQVSQPEWVPSVQRWQEEGGAGPSALQATGWACDCQRAPANSLGGNLKTSRNQPNYPSMHRHDSSPGASGHGKHRRGNKSKSESPRRPPNGPRVRPALRSRPSGLPAPSLYPPRARKTQVWGLAHLL